MFNDPLSLKEALISSGIPKDKIPCMHQIFQNNGINDVDSFDLLHESDFDQMNVSIGSKRKMLDYIKNNRSHKKKRCIQLDEEDSLCMDSQAELLLTPNNCKLSSYTIKSPIKNEAIAKIGKDWYNNNIGFFDTEKGNIVMINTLDKVEHSDIITKRNIICNVWASLDQHNDKKVTNKMKDLVESILQDSLRTSNKSWNSITFTRKQMLGSSSRKKSSNFQFF